MAAYATLHLLPQPAQADPPSPAVAMSATSPSGGVLTTQLLDPASPSPIATGANQVVQGVNFNVAPSTTLNIVLGRFLTKPLPAQSIGAGTWTFYAAQRAITTSSSGVTIYTNVWGFTVAQWRPPGNLIARALDTPASGTAYQFFTTGSDIAGWNAQSGSALTLSAGDCLIIEVWAQVQNTGAITSVDTQIALLLGGAGEYARSVYTYNSLTNTDAVLVAPAAITFS